MLHIQFHLFAHVLRQEWVIFKNLALDLPSDQATFFNFLASHDGIGVTPVRDILTQEEIDAAVERTHQLGGNVAYKSNGDGTQSPYELNINYLDALGDPEAPLNEPGLISKRFFAAQAIMLALRGVPGIYFHSLVGSQNWEEGVAQSGRYRAINRQKLSLEILDAELARSNSLRQLIYQGMYHLLNVRQAHPAFHPFGSQKVLTLHPAIFGLIRTSLDEQENLLCLHNISGEEVRLTLDLNLLPLKKNHSLFDIVGARSHPVKDGMLEISLSPYDTMWLRV